MYGARAVAEPLRRQGPPRGGAPHPRQHDPQLGTDRRRLAAAAPRPEYAAGADRLDAIRPARPPSPSPWPRLRSRSPCIAAIVRRITGSRTGAILAAMLFAFNPNVLYLQSTPMTEPLLFALRRWWCCTSRMGAVNGRVGHQRAWRAPAACWTIVAACLTRYEAWPIAGAAIVLAAYVKWRRGTVFTAVLAKAAKPALFAVATVLFFIGLSFATTGKWFVTGGSTCRPKLQGQPAGGRRRDSRRGRGAFRSALRPVGVVRGRDHHRRVVAAAIVERRYIMPLALLAPRRCPSMRTCPAIPSSFAMRSAGARRAACIGPAVCSALPRADRRHSDAGAGDGAIAVLRPPRADRDRSANRSLRNGMGRRRDRMPAAAIDGTTIMASMGSLAHYMQELSHAGFDLDDFLHEGSGPIWGVALTRIRRCRSRVDADRGSCRGRRRVVHREVSPVPSGLSVVSTRVALKATTWR